MKNDAKNYTSFLIRKQHSGLDSGFKSRFMPSALFDFQVSLVDRAVRKGRAAIFADCGLGKTPIQLTWAQNVVEHTNKPVLVLAPLAVSRQTVREGEKFGIECKRSDNGKIQAKITVTNYERLHYFDPSEFAGVVCDESSILKSFNGERRQAITTFMKKIQYRLLATATAAPNDYHELGTSSEALGGLGYMDMLNRFFKNDHNNSATGRMYGEQVKWRLKGHAKEQFWRWVCSWAWALRYPSDLGFDDGDFILPPLNECEHYIVGTRAPVRGAFFTTPAIGLKEQREERRSTIVERCEKAASLVNDTGQPALVWCHLNDEGNLLARLIPDAVQVAGSDSDEVKTERLLSFANNEVRVLITKPKIGAWGLNFQHCAHIVSFISHSYEQYYQGVRRCWRFGQKRAVDVDLVMSKGEEVVLSNLKRKASQAEEMFDNLVAEMNRGLAIKSVNKFIKKEEIPPWL